MKTREANLAPTSKMFHWHDGTMEFRTDGGVFLLTKNEADKLQVYFADIERGWGDKYEPGRAE